MFVIGNRLKRRFREPWATHRINRTSPRLAGASVSRRNELADRDSVIPTPSIANFADAREYAGLCG